MHKKHAKFCFYIDEDDEKRVDALVNKKLKNIKTVPLKRKMPVSVNLKDDRYQYQSWYVRLYRRRFYFLIPFLTLQIWLKRPISEEIVPLSLKNSWHLAKGLIQLKMNWVYNWNEISENTEDIQTS